MFLCVTDIIQNGITVAGITACAGATGALGAAGCTLAISSISITTAQMIHGRGICEGCFNNSVYECTNGRPEAYGLSGIEPINLKAPAPGNPVYAYCSSGSAGAEQYKGNCGDRASVYDIAACCASYCNVSNPYDPPPPPPATDGGGGGGSGGTTISADTFVGTNGTGGDSWQITCSNDGGTGIRRRLAGLPGGHLTILNDFDRRVGPMAMIPRAKAWKLARARSCRPFYERADAIRALAMATISWRK